MLEDVLLLPLDAEVSPLFSEWFDVPPSFDIFADSSCSMSSALFDPICSLGFWYRGALSTLSDVGAEFDRCDFTSVVLPSSVRSPVPLGAAALPAFGVDVSAPFDVDEPPVPGGGTDVLEWAVPVLP